MGLGKEPKLQQRSVLAIKSQQSVRFCATSLWDKVTHRPWEERIALALSQLYTFLSGLLHKPKWFPSGLPGWSGISTAKNLDSTTYHPGLEMPLLASALPLKCLTSQLAIEDYKESLQWSSSLPLQREFSHSPFMLLWAETGHCSGYPKAYDGLSQHHQGQVYWIWTLRPSATKVLC